MREHRYTLDLPHSASRLWALMQDYDRWTEYAPMVVGVQVVYPGDERGDGLVRRVTYRLPLGRRGHALELVHDVVPEQGYTYTMIARAPGQDQTGRVSLERLGADHTRLRFEERYHLTKIPWRWLEGPIYRFINKQNEASMRRLSAWLSQHPEYRADLVEGAANP